MANPDTLGEALAGVDRVLMISSSSLDMVETQCTFIDACRAAGVRHIIKFSGLAADPERALPVRSDALCRGAAPRELGPRVGRICGPRASCRNICGKRRASSMRARSTFRWARPGSTRSTSPTSVRSASICCATVVMRAEIIPVTGPEALTMGDVADRISQATGRTVRYVPISREQRRSALVAHGIPEMFADVLDKQVEERLKGGVESKVDLAANALFEVQPTSFLEFARRNAEAFGGSAPRSAQQEAAVRNTTGGSTVNLKDRNVVVTGGSRGLGLGLVEALVDQGAQVTVVARDPTDLASLEKKLGVKTIAADVTDEGIAQKVLGELRPDVLILNAGATPRMGRLDELSWSDFSIAWETDVKAGLYWMQAALNLPLAPGARVLVTSSGAAVDGSPLTRRLCRGQAHALADGQICQQGRRPEAARSPFPGDRPAADHRRHRRRGQASCCLLQVARHRPETYLERFGAPYAAPPIREHLVDAIQDPQYANAVALT